MTLKGKLILWSMPIFLRLVYLLHIRKPWSLFCRWLQRETARHPLHNYPAPGELETAMKAFQYRRDPFNGQLDYTSHPEYVEAALRDPALKDGDCDDGHWYVANALKKIPGVEIVYFLSSGWDGPKSIGGHATAVYKYHGKWYHYDWGIHEIEDPNLAVKAVAERYGGTGAVPTFWVWESVGEIGNDRSAWRPLAICPRNL